MTTDNLLIASR